MAPSQQTPEPGSFFSIFTFFKFYRVLQKKIKGSVCQVNQTSASRGSFPVLLPPVSRPAKPIRLIKIKPAAI